MARPSTSYLSRFSCRSVRGKDEIRAVVRLQLTQCTALTSRPFPLCRKGSGVSGKKLRRSVITKSSEAGSYVHGIQNLSGDQFNSLYKVLFKRTPLESSSPSGWLACRHLKTAAGRAGTVPIATNKHLADGAQNAMDVAVAMVALSQSHMTVSPLDRRRRRRW